MKKYYSAPNIEFEDFSLSTSISAGCDKIVKNPHLYSCGVKYPLVGTIFVEGVDACLKKIEDGEQGDGYCYHAPTEDTNMFTS